jgi:trans-aconitate 2-methyltransferase
VESESPGRIDLLQCRVALARRPWRPLFPRLVGSVEPGGVLAVQMPRNFGAPSHTLLVDTARSPRWSDRLESLVRPVPVSDPAFYHDVLAPLVSDLDVWETEYLHVLSGADPVAAWTRGSAALPYLQALGPHADAFMSDYADALRLAYPMRQDGTTLLPFRRLFILARR